MVGAITAAILFEFVRSGYAFLVAQTDAGSLYTGTIAAVVTVVFWTYYASLVFLLGGEIAIQSAIGGGTCITITLPLFDTSPSLPLSAAVSGNA